MVGLEQTGMESTRVESYEEMRKKKKKQKGLSRLH